MKKILSQLAVILIPMTIHAQLQIPICLVSSDTVTSTTNIVVWEKPPAAGIDSFFIYRKISSVMTRIGAQPYAALSIFVDSTQGVSPKTQAHEYAISVLDTLGIQSAMSLSFITIHLQQPVYSGPPHRFDLTWSNYQGFAFNNYEIWRDLNNNNNWVKIDSVLYGLPTNYSDMNVSSDSARYRIVSVPAIPCMASIKNPDAMATSVKSAKSNSSDRVAGSSAVVDIFDESKLSIYPNPNSGLFSIEFKTQAAPGIKIFNVLGEEVEWIKWRDSKNKIEGDLRNMPGGVYYIQAISDKAVITRKVVIE